MAVNVILILRITQLVFAIIVLGTMAYVASLFKYSNCPSQVAFLIFCAVWTIFPALTYLTLASRYWPYITHKLVTLAFEALTMLFWFAGFIAVAVYVSDFWSFCDASLCSSTKAGTAFGAFEWLLFAATTAMATIHVIRTRHDSGGASSTAKTVQQQYVESTGT